MLQSLELRAWQGVESPLPADAPKTLAGSDLPQVGGPWVEPGAVWGTPDREMALHFSRIDAAKDELEIWSASECGFSFVISNESISGPGLHGRPGFVASWRPIDINRPAIRIIGSPFKTFAEAEQACEAMLVHLTE